MISCDTCAYFEYDEDDEAWYCTVDMDEDDYAALVFGQRKECPFNRDRDEYRIVRKQM